MKFRPVSGGDKGGILLQSGGWSGCTDAGSSSKSASHASQSAPITKLIYTITGRGGGVFPLNSILEHHWCFFILQIMEIKRATGWVASLCILQQKKWVHSSSGVCSNQPLSSAQIFPNLVYNHGSPPSHDPRCQQAVGLIRFSNLITSTPTRRQRSTPTRNKKNPLTTSIYR